MSSESPMSQSLTPPNQPISPNTPIVAASQPAVSAATAKVARNLGVISHLGEASRIAQELFPGPLDIQSEEDPDIEGAWRIVFRVEGSGSADDIADRHVEWCQRIVRLPKPASTYYCLSIGVTISNS